MNLGVGSQFTSMISGILLMAVLGMFNVHHHNTLNSAGVILYAFTSCKPTVSGDMTMLEKYHAVPKEIFLDRVLPVRET